MSELVFILLVWLSGFVFGWALHERDWSRAYIHENKRLMKLLGERNERIRALEDGST